MSTRKWCIVFTDNTSSIVDEGHTRYGNGIKLCMQDKRVKMHVRVQANRPRLKWNGKQKLELSCSISSPIRSHSARQKPIRTV